MRITIPADESVNISVDLEDTQIIAAMNVLKSIQSFFDGNSTMLKPFRSGDDPFTLVYKDNDSPEMKTGDASQNRIMDGLEAVSRRLAREVVGDAQKLMQTKNEDVIGKYLDKIILQHNSGKTKQN